MTHAADDRARIADATTITPEQWLQRQRRAGMMDVTCDCLMRSGADRDAIVLGLAGSDGAVHRFHMPAGDAARMARDILDLVAAHYPCEGQSPRSSGMPSVAVSTPLDSEKVCPPERSDAACAGST